MHSEDERLCQCQSERDQDPDSLPRLTSSRPVTQASLKRRSKDAEDTSSQKIPKCQDNNNGESSLNFGEKDEREESPKEKEKSKLKEKKSSTIERLREDFRLDNLEKLNSDSSSEESVGSWKCWKRMDSGTSRQVWS